MTEKIKIKIISPKTVIYSGDADSISSFNSKGKFDILFNHTHFISEIRDQIIINNDNNNQKIEIKNGVLRCFDNEIQVYIVQ